MRAQQQNVILLVQTQQPHAQQWTIYQIKWLPDRVRNNLSRLASGNPFKLNLHGLRRKNVLRGCSVESRKNRAQHFMTSHDLIQTLLEHRDIESALQTKRRMNVIKRILSLVSIEKP